jgi:4-amino-4-deoxy-L-arabinose transferase-like glycosyltransferase
MGQFVLGWSHPDYPLLIPSCIARVWAYLGHETPLAAGLISIFFACATIGTLVGAVAMLRNWETALVGGLVLLGTPFFLNYAAGELADIPVGFFVLAATAFIVLSGHNSEDTRFLILAGVAAGLAAWTKNEGLQFCAVAILALGSYHLFIRSFRGFGFFTAAAAVTLLSVWYFKVWIAPPNDLLANQGVGTLDLVRDGSRHRIILSSLLHEGAKFGEWTLCPFGVMALYLVGQGNRRWARVEFVAPVILILMLAGYYGVYLVTPYDLSWHLGSSLNRLLLQLWPLTIFVWCMSAPAQKDGMISNGPSSGRHGPRVWVWGNIGLAACLLYLMLIR